MLGGFDLQTIYHYCSIETFSLIIKNKAIRLSDLDKTNDYMEKRWGVALIEDALKKELENLSIKIDLRADYWYSDDASNHMEYLLDLLKWRLSYQTLIACFSLEKDSLSQWRAYGQDGEGIAIGFNYNLLKRFIKTNKDIAIKKVLYKKEMQEKEIRKSAIDPVLTYMKDMYEEDEVRCTDDFNIYFEEEFDCFCEVLVDYLDPIISYIKNPAFCEEKEVRIFYNTPICEESEEDFIVETCKREWNIGQNNELLIKPIDFQTKEGKLVAYADLIFEKLLSKGIINEVIIGPKSQISKNDIRYLLLVNGYGDNIKINKSDATYR